MYRQITTAVLLSILSAVTLAGCMNRSLPPDPENSGGLLNDFAKAIRDSDEARVAELLAVEPLLLNEPHPTGSQYPLHVAAALGDGDMVRYLLEQGANPFVQNDEGEYPADLARSAGASEDVITLLEKGLQ